jgi:phospholipid transport system substrate-binding protein
MHPNLNLSSSSIQRSTCSAARRQWLAGVAAGWAVLGAMMIAAMPVTASAQTAALAPDALVRQVSTEVIETVKADRDIQAGNLGKIIALVDAKVMPHVNFQRMTAIAVGRAWRSATPEQQKRLLEEFKTLLMRTYSGALTQVKDQTVQLKPLRAGADDPEVVVRTEVKGKGDPIQLDYRLEKTANGWKIYDVNVLGVWLADTSFKSQFSPVVSANGIDGLIANLTELNRKAAGGKA